jgi:hypothetical protein
MPHTTHAYPFEAKVGQFAGELSSRCSSEASLRSFLIVLDRDGNVLSVSFEDGTANLHERVRALNTLGTPYLFCEPLEDGMEYIWLSWRGIERAVMERLIDQRFEEADFLPVPDFAYRAGTLPQANQYPQSWGVMF